MGICKNCIFFRRVRPISQLLAQEIGTADSEISKALNKIQEDENQQKGYEAQLKVKKETINDPIWDDRPVMSDFCGNEEKDGKYLIAELKNRGGQCKDYKEGHPEKRTCNTCKYKVSPEGLMNDLKIEETYSNMSTQAISTNLSTNTTDNLLNSARQGSASRKAYELTGIYSAKGILYTKPNYFSYCSKDSFEDEYIICALKNTHNTCPFWEASFEGQAKMETNTIPMPPQETKINDVKFGLTTHPIEQRTEVSPAARMKSDTKNEDIESLFNKFLLMFKEVLGFEPDKWINDAHCELSTNWSKLQKGFNDITSDLDWIHRKDFCKGYYFDYMRARRELLVLEWLKNWSSSHPWAEDALQDYYENNPIVVEGSPPLRRKTLNYWLLYVDMMYREVTCNNQKIVDWMAAERSLIQTYPNTGEEERQWLLNIAVIYNGLKLRAYFAKDEEEIRTKLKLEPFSPEEIQEILIFWSKVINVPLSSPPVKNNGSIDSPTEPVKNNGSIDSPTDRGISTLERLDNEIAQIQNKLTEAQIKGDTMKVTELNIELQKKLNASQAWAQLTSNIMKMQHDTMMNTIKNIK